MAEIFTVIQIVFGVILSILVLMQAKGTGLGRTFGQSASYHSKRGVEVVVFRLTIAMAALFVVFSVVNQFFAQG